MSNRTIYTCDRCKSDVTSSDELVTVWAQIGYAEDWDRPSCGEAVTAEWCVPCVKEVAPMLMTRRERHKAAEAKQAIPYPPTLEEMLRAIVREEIEAANG